MTVLGLLVFVWGLSLAAASGGHSSSRCGGRSSSRCAGLSLSRPLPSRGTGSRRAGSAVVAHGPSRSAACGIFPDQGPNPCPLHWQADSQPLRHQGSSSIYSFNNFLIYHIAVLATVIMLFITSPVLIYLITGSMYLLTTFLQLPPPLLPLVTTSLISFPMSLLSVCLFVLICF